MQNVCAPRSLEISWNLNGRKMRLTKADGREDIRSSRRVLEHFASRSRLIVRMICAMILKRGKVGPEGR